MRRIRAVLIDIDGVLTVSWKPLPGAVAALKWLRAAAFPLALVTNTTSRTRASIASALAEAGFPVTADDILTAPVIAGHGVTLRLPQSMDYTAWAALREQSRAFLTPWEPIWPADDLTRTAFRRRIRRYAEDQRNDLAYACLVFRTGDDALVGGLTLANIRRGVAQAGSIGYWVGDAFSGRGWAAGGC